MKPIFSGDDSQQFWETINTAESIPQLRRAIYLMGCKMQELEARLFLEPSCPTSLDFRLTDESGRIKPGPKPSGRAMTNAQRQGKWRARNPELSKKRVRESMSRSRAKKASLTK